MSRKFTKIIIFCLFILMPACLIASQANAADEVKFTPEVGIGGQFTEAANITVTNNTANIAEYIKQIYKYLIGIVAIVAVVVMMLGGVIWITAGGSSSRVGEAQTWIKASLTGLLLVMFSYVILKTVNPALVNFKISTIDKVNPGCCQYKDGSTKNTGESSCAKAGGSFYAGKNSVGGKSCVGGTDASPCEYTETRMEPGAKMPTKIPRCGTLTIDECNKNGGTVCSSGKCKNEMVCQEESAMKDLSEECERDSDCKVGLYCDAIEGHTKQCMNGNDGNPCDSHMKNGEDPCPAGSTCTREATTATESKFTWACRLKIP